MSFMIRSMCNFRGCDCTANSTFFPVAVRIALPAGLGVRHRAARGKGGAELHVADRAVLIVNGGGSAGCRRLQVFSSRSLHGRMVRERQIRNCADCVAVLVEKLSAIVTFLVLVPTFYCTGRVLCRYGGLVCVSTGYRYRAGIDKVAVRSFDGDGGGAFLNTGYCSGCRVYSGNGSIAGCKQNSFVCCFCRCNGERRGLCLPDIDRQCLVNGYAGNGYRSGGDSHGCRDTSRIFGFVVLVVGYQFNQCDFVILCSCVVVNGTLEFHQCQFIGSCETLRTETVQDHIGNRCPFYRVPTKSSFDTIFKFSATCNKGQTVWNDKSAFQSVLVPRLLHVDGEIDGITGVC